MNQPDFGRKLIEIRRANGLTQDELAEKCKITVRTIQRIESGLVKPRAFTIKVFSTTLGFDFFEGPESVNDFVMKNRDSKLKWIKILLWHGKDLFNLKTNTMKKVAILSIISFSIIIGLFMVVPESKAQNPKNIDLSKFMKTNGRGIKYFFPKDELRMISNVKDTADYKIKGGIIQEYKNKIFLNGKFVGKALDSDTVIYFDGKIIIKPSYWKFTSSYGQNIHYLIPYGVPIKDVSVQIDTENIYIDNHIIREYGYKIFLDGVFQGQVQSGDTVIFKDGKIILEK